MQRVGLAVKVLDSACGSDGECLCFQVGPVCVWVYVHTHVWALCSAEKSGWVGGSDIAFGVCVCSDVH